MFLEIQQRIREKVVEAVRELFHAEIEAPALGVPPSLEMGELSAATCFELARKLRQSPQKIAEQLAPRLLPLSGIARVTVAGGGYLNFHLDRPAFAAALFRNRRSPAPPESIPRAKILVEHTSINPNKAAHIGHLRNAVLGDTFVRVCRFRGHPVEIQNYIDNTGVQVADVVVGFIHLEKKSVDDVRRLIEDPSVRFDYFCWDLYARVFQLYEENPEALRLREEALKAIEEGQGDWARLAELVSTAIVRKHLETMERINVRYDLLVQESEILRLDFWKSAFEVLKQRAAIRFETSGKNAGCWVMSLEDAGRGESEPEPGAEDVKIIVRSNGTVTYVGKDIAYHLWKFALLGKDFGYEVFHRYPDRQPVWRTAVNGQAGAPRFGNAGVGYSVIDTRQSYLQNIVGAAFRALGFHDQAANLHHFAYEVVGLSPSCASEMGFELSEKERQRTYVEVSGRRGLGVKADDLLDALVAKAIEEVRNRQMTENTQEQETYGRMIAVGALRYFLLKISRRMVIAFDVKDALAFEGETGPYLQYTVVRARNILRKFQESNPGSPAGQAQHLEELVSPEQLGAFLKSEDALPFWELILLAGQLEMAVDQAVSSTEPAVLAKYAFRLAQSFNNFYHRYHVLSESDPARQKFLLFLVQLVNATMSRTVDLLGIEIPERM